MCGTWFHLFVVFVFIGVRLGLHWREVGGACPNGIWNKQRIGRICQWSTGQAHSPVRPCLRHLCRLAGSTAFPRIVGAFSNPSRSVYCGYRLSNL